MKPQRADRVPWRQIDGRAVIVQPRLGQVHELSEVATLLWSKADGQRSLDDLAALVAEEFEVTADEAAGDAREFFDHLAGIGLIRWNSA
jgi:hypothetical protein